MLLIDTSVLVLIKIKEYWIASQGDETTVKLGTYRGKLETVWSECGADPSAYQEIIYLNKGYQGIRQRADELMYIPNDYT